ncbi:MAG: hypothetical protein AAF497_29320, partial [Planctomycetota bacterium]
MSTTYLSDHNFFLNRTGFRQKLVSIAQEHGSLSTLLVRTEERRCGKSYGRLIFFEVARAVNAQAIYINSQIASSLDEVLTYIYDELDVEPKAIEDSTDQACLRGICQYLKRKAKEKQAYIWIAIDDLGITSDARLHPDVKVFFDHFAAMMVNRSFRKHFRLVLIDYPKQNVTNWGSDLWVEDNPTHSDVDRQDVLEFLDEFAATNHLRMLQASKEAIADSAIQAAEQCPPTER